jgi:peptidoglycan/LPS O-acetylase OafA/YrhL
VLNETGLLDVRIVGQWLPAYIDWFAGGMALALVQARFAAGVVGPASPLRRLEDLAHSAGTCWATALAVFALATSPLAGPVTFRDAGGVPPAWGLVFKNVLYLLVALLVVLPLVLGPQDAGVLRRVLSTRPLQWLGEISYGIFLWHLLVLDGVTRLRHQQLFTGSWLVLMALTWSATVLVSWLSYRWLERPVMRWRRAAPVLVPRPRTSVDHTTTSPVAQSA